MDNRRGLEMWGPVGRWVFLNWPRGSWQYDLICGAIIVGLFVLPNPTPQGADLDAVLSAISAANDEVESFTADMVSTERVELFDDETTESGTVAFLKPAFIRREITVPSARTELVGEDEYMMYIPRIKQARIYPIEDTGDDGLELDVPGMGGGDLREMFDVSLQEVTTDAADGASLFVLRLLPKAETRAARSYKAILLSVAEGEWHPARRIVLQEHSGDTTTILLSNFDRDPGLEPDDFRLDLPSDVEIIRQGAESAP